MSNIEKIIKEFKQITKETGIIFDKEDTIIKSCNDAIESIKKEYKRKQCKCWCHKDKKGKTCGQIHKPIALENKNHPLRTEILLQWMKDIKEHALCN